MTSSYWTLWDVPYWQIIHQVAPLIVAINIFRWICCARCCASNSLMCFFFQSWMAFCLLGSWMMLTYSQCWSCRSCTWTNWIVVWWCATQLSVLVRKVLWAPSRENERNCWSWSLPRFCCSNMRWCFGIFWQIDVISVWPTGLWN